MDPLGDMIKVCLYYKWMSDAKIRLSNIIPIHSVLSLPYSGYKVDNQDI